MQSMSRRLVHAMLATLAALSLCMMEVAPASSTEVAKARPLPPGRSVWFPVEYVGYTPDATVFLVLRQTGSSLAAATVAIGYTYQPERASIAGVSCVPVVVDSAGAGGGADEYFLGESPPSGPQIIFDGKELLVTRLDQDFWTSYKRSSIAGISRHLRTHGGHRSVATIARMVRQCWK